MCYLENKDNHQKYYNKKETFQEKGSFYFILGNFIKESTISFTVYKEQFWKIDAHFA